MKSVPLGCGYENYVFLQRLGARQLVGSQSEIQFYSMFPLISFHYVRSVQCRVVEVAGLLKSTSTVIILF